MTNAARPANGPGLRARCLALAFLLVILGTVPGRGAEGARPGSASRCAAADCAARPVRGVTVYRGLVLDYEVVDGMAVHGGDMVLGTAAEAAAAAPSREAPERERSGGVARRDAYVVQNLWPDGKVPYVIDERIEDLEVIRAALEEWNSKTVIEFFPRTDEQDYALLVPRSPGSSCSSGLGRGSPTIVATGGCGLGATIHELGHAVGLWHEHQRPDRDKFLAMPPVYSSVSPDPSIGTVPWSAGSVSPEGGLMPYDDRLPYDYRSVMHYYVPFGASSIPPGIPVFRSGLSVGDIDGVARLYGKHPGTSTVSTVPPGLALMVDGESVTTPAQFDWLPGSVHTLEAPLLQDLEGVDDGRVGVFGSWNDGGSWSDGGRRKRTVKVGQDGIWLAAHFIPLYGDTPRVAFPRNAATVAVSPESGLHPKGGVLVELTAIPAAGTPYEFARWSFQTNPVPGRWPGLVLKTETLRLPVGWVAAAHFGTPPFYRIGSNVRGLWFPFSVNGRTWLAPAAFEPADLPAGSKVSVPEFTDILSPFGRHGRYRFSGWSDGGERAHEIEAPAGGGSLTFNVQREFRLRVASSSIVVSPQSEDGFYPSGSQVQLTATPQTDFSHWEGDLSGTATTQSVIMDRDRLVVARFDGGNRPHVPVPFGEPFQTDFRPGVKQHSLRVPDGTSQIAVRFESSAPAPGAELRVTGWFTSFGSRPLGSDSAITIGREELSLWRERSSASLAGQRLEIWQHGGSPASGRLHVSIQRDWIAGVWPRAFTFVLPAGSGPVSQRMRVAPVRGEVPHVRYRIVADRHWLEAFPPEWTGAEGEVEIAVTANAAALAAEAYRGRLRIQTRRDGDPAAGWTPTGIEIPVHFVVTPTDGAGEPPGDESSGLAGGDDHGDTRGAATEIAVGAAARGRLEEAGDEDWFRFRTTAAGTRVTLYTESTGDTAGELRVAGSDAPVADDDAGSGGNFRIVTIVPAGTHYVRVSGFGTPDYTLMLESHDVPLDKMQFVRIPAGSFVMGSPEDERGRRVDEGPQREVTISRGFWLGKYEVTQGEWEAVMGANPSVFQECGSRCPVEHVSWEDVQGFIRRLNILDPGKGYRLPTEAEWEYAARAGTVGARNGDLDDVAWWFGNSGGRTHPVGEKRANAWGLHDMLGNVSEWTSDWYRSYPGAEYGFYRPGPGRVFRGGGWPHPARFFRSARRYSGSPGNRGGSLGFRLARTD